MDTLAIPLAPEVAARHEAKVTRIAADVRERAAARAQGAAASFASLGKSSVSHFVPNPNDPRHSDRKINVRDLQEILAIDVANKRCVAEPGVTFERLVAATLPHGLVPKLVPELKTITIGGAVSGCSVESMSYKYGGFHDNCLSYELVTGTGEVLTCSRDQDPLLFEMVHGSYGTLGIITKLTFALIPAKPYVHLAYRTFLTFAEFDAGMLAALRDPAIDVVDGIVHAKDRFVLCVGTFVDTAPYTSRYDVDIYYQSTRCKAEDYLTTADYFFRYDTECHWLTRNLPFGENRLVRSLLKDHLLGSTNLLRLTEKLRPWLRRGWNPEVVIDLFIPHRNFEAFYRWYEDTLDYFPLWIVPYRIGKPYPWVNSAYAETMQDELLIDCAIYGKRNDTPGVDYYKLLEDKTHELAGIKTLISHNRYTRESFWTVYNRDNWETVKRRTDPHNLFRDLYEKFNPQATP